jgi:hypothetical protein
MAKVEQPEREAEQREVNNNLNNFFRAVNYSDFLNYFLPIDEEIVQNVLYQLEKLPSGYNLNAKKWKAFPDNPCKVSELYQAFVATANEIKQLVKQLGGNNGIEGRWVDCSHDSPESSDYCAAALRPDIAFVSAQTTDEALETMSNRLKDLDKELDGKRSTRTKEAEYPEVGQLELHVIKMLIRYLMLHWVS